jgi:hypothetical protein
LELSLETGLCERGHNQLLRDHELLLDDVLGSHHDVQLKDVAKKRGDVKIIMMCSPYDVHYED